MTISSTNRKAGPFIGNDSASVFPFAFSVFSAADVYAVQLNTVTSVETPLALGADYTVALNADQSANPGGTLTLTAGPLATGFTLTLTTAVTPLQLTDLTNQGGFYPRVITRAFDKLTVLTQQILERLGRSLTLPLSTSANVSTALPAPVANNVIGWNESANGFKNFAPVDNTLLAASLASVEAGKGAALIGGLIADSVTLNVPSQYATISAAFSYLSTKTIARGATVTIQVADGTYNLTHGIDLNHPDGERIRLLGNQTTPDNCVLMGTNPPTFSALSCTNGHKFGYVNGFKIDLAAKATLANNYSGIYAGTGATIVLGPKIKVNNWYYGINASYNSTIFADYAQVSNAGDVGIWAFCGSQVQARYASSTGASDTVNGWGFGFQAEFGSQMECAYASASGCNIAGFAALSNSQLRAHNTTASDNTGSGFLARDEGQIENHNATASSNTRYGEEFIRGGSINGSGKTISGNTLGANNGRVYFDNGSLGARIAADGALRIDTNYGDPIYFNTSGGLQFGIGHAANAVNRWNVQGSATGSGTYLDAVGSDTNISANVSAKGAEVVRLRSNGKTAFQAFAESALAVNYVQADASVAGSPVKLSAQGSDSVIDLQLFPKGAGSYVQFGTDWTSTGDVVCNGYVPIKDSGGTVRKLMTTA